MNENARLGLVRTILNSQSYLNSSDEQQRRIQQTILNTGEVSPIELNYLIDEEVSEEFGYPSPQDIKDVLSYLGSDEYQYKSKSEKDAVLRAYVNRGQISSDEFNRLAKQATREWNSQRQNRQQYGPGDSNGLHLHLNSRKLCSVLITRALESLSEEHQEALMNYLEILGIDGENIEDLCVKLLELAMTEVGQIREKISDRRQSRREEKLSRQSMGRSNQQSYSNNQPNTEFY
jgi:hypothetical protein